MIETIFPCQIGTYNLDLAAEKDLFNNWLTEQESLYKDDYEVNKSLRTDIQTFRGFQVSFQSWPWESQIPGLPEIWKIVESSAGEFLQEIYNDKKMWPQYLNGWAVRYGAGSWQGPHIHRNADFTIVLYTLKENLEGGNLLIHNPMPISQYSNFSSSISMNIDENMMIILPSWLTHSVDPIIAGSRNIAVFDIKAHKIMF